MDSDLLFIDRFLAQQLSLEEIDDFNLRLANDPDFRLKFNFLNDVKSASVETEARRIKKILIEVDNAEWDDNNRKTDFSTGLQEGAISEHKKDPVISRNRFKYPTLTLLAASVLILMVLQISKPSDEKLFVEYAKTNNYSEHEKWYLNEDESVLGKGTRGSNDKWSVSILEKILISEKDFRNGEYSKVKLSLGSILNENNKRENPRLLLMLSISQLKTGETEQALLNLKILQKQPTHNLQNIVNYHLAFAYLKLGDRKQAKELLESVSKSDGEMSMESKALLKNMRWIKIEI